MKARHILVLAVVLFGGALVAALQTRTEAAKLATAVVAVDQTGQDPALAEGQLDAYAKLHMLTGTTVFLTGSYNRAVSAAQAAANPASNGAIYAQAQAACASHADSLVQARCVQAYIAAHSQAGVNPQAMPMPTKASYTKSFTSPVWTPDATGLLLAAAFAALALAAAMVSAGRL